MKKTITLFIIFITSLFETNGQTLNKDILGNFIQINDTLYISKFEVSIREYSSFLLYLLNNKKNINEVTEFLPMPNNVYWKYWDEFNDKVDVFASSLYEIEDSLTSIMKKPSIVFTTYFGDFPIVNVDLNKANSYCNFKTFQYQFIYNNLNERKKRKFPNNLIFRLLTEQEWKLISTTSFDSTNVICTDYYSKKNYSTIKSPQQIYNGSVNKYGIYNVYGNVAELIGNGQIFGGSFNNSLKECQAQDNNTNFENSNNDVGFRIVAVIK